MGRLRWLTENLVAVTGTTESVSPLQLKIQSGYYQDEKWLLIENQKEKSVVYLKTQILRPAAISCLYVGNTESSESFQLLIRTSLHYQYNKEKINK